MGPYQTPKGCISNIEGPVKPLYQDFLKLISRVVSIRCCACSKRNKILSVELHMQAQVGLEARTVRIESKSVLEVESS